MSISASITVTRDTATPEMQKKLDAYQDKGQGTLTQEQVLERIGFENPAQQLEELERDRQRMIAQEVYAPLERHIIEQRMWMLDDNSFVGTHYRSDDYNKPPYNRYTIIRAQFDKWFSSKVREAGALLICETTVEELLMDGKRCIGGRLAAVRLVRGDDCVIARHGGLLDAGEPLVLGGGTLLAQILRRIWKMLRNHPGIHAQRFRLRDVETGCRCDGRHHSIVFRHWLVLSGLMGHLKPG